MDIFEIASALADYLHDEDKTFADVAEQLERQTNQMLELMRQDDEANAENASVFSEPFLEEDEPEEDSVYLPGTDHELPESPHYPD